MYEVETGNQTIGVVSIFEKENMTYFYVEDRHIRHAQAAFKAALDFFTPDYAFVATNEELFLSLCMDVYQSIEKQAFFFSKGSENVCPAEFPREYLAQATPNDEADLLDSEGVSENIRLGKFFEKMVCSSAKVFLPHRQYLRIWPLSA